jgi:hypothetical protein
MGVSNSSYCRNQEGIALTEGESICLADMQESLKCFPQSIPLGEAQRLAGMQESLKDLTDGCWEIQWCDEAKCFCYYSVVQGKRYTHPALENSDIAPSAPSKKERHMALRPRLASNAARIAASDSAFALSQPLGQVGCDEPVRPEVKPRGVPLTWDTPDGVKTVYATEKVLGLQFAPSLPVKVSNDQEGHSKDLGVRVGWILRSVNGIDVTCKTNFKEVMQTLHKEVGLRPEPKHHNSTQRTVLVPLTWDTPNGERTVYAAKKTLGLQFPSSLPVRTHHVQEGHGKDIGIEVGWILRKVNGIDVTRKTDFKEVMDILHREVGVSPEAKLKETVQQNKQ